MRFYGREIVKQTLTTIGLAPSISNTVLIVLDKVGELKGLSAYNVLLYPRQHNCNLKHCVQ